MSWMIQTAVKGLANKLSTDLSVFNNNVVAFQGEREKLQKYPYLVVDTSGWNINQVFDHNETIENNGINYLLHQDGLAIINIDLWIGTRHKQPLLNYSEQVIADIMPKMQADGTIPETGVFFEIQELTTGLTAPVRIENFDFMYEYSKIDTDRYEAHLGLLLNVPWVRVFAPVAGVTPPNWEMVLDLQWDIT